jgi:hypothetical protein
MRFLALVALLTLAGCSGQEQQAQTLLNEYAAAAASGQDLTSYLTSEALSSAQESQLLIEELGLSSFGRGRFSETKALSSGKFQSCLDVSEIRFLDANAEPFELERMARQWVFVEIHDDLISDLQLAGEVC